MSEHLIWVCCNRPQGFEDLSRVEMEMSGLTQVSKRFFYGDTFDLQRSAYGKFTIEEVSRGTSPKEAIKNINVSIPSPYRVEKFDKKRRRGSTGYAHLVEKYHGGIARASNPKSVLFVFTPDNQVWITGFLHEKKDSLLEQLEKITERTCVSLPPHAALALINISGNTPLVDPCCGTGMIPLASMLRNRVTYGADNNKNMIEKAEKNCRTVGVPLNIELKDAFEPWVNDVSLVCDFPAGRSWCSKNIDLSIEIFTHWIPFVKSFCVIFPKKLLTKIPQSVNITHTINFTADRVIVLGTP